MVQSRTLDVEETLSFDIGWPQAKEDLEESGAWAVHVVSYLVSACVRLFLSFSAFFSCAAGG